MLVQKRMKRSHGLLEEFRQNVMSLNLHILGAAFALGLNFFFGGGRGGVFDNFGTEGAGLNDEKVVMVGYLTRALDFMS